MSERALARERALLGRAHDGVAAALVACRPLLWDEVPTDPSVIAYDTLMVAGLMLLAIEAIAGLRSHWRVSPRGALLGAVLALLGIAMAHAPLPAQAWGLWSQLLCDGALAWYLVQVVPGRARLLSAALAGGLVSELAICVLQEAWVLPAMARKQAAHQLAVPPALASLVAERIANGGVFGTFTQANALAGYLLVVGPAVLMGLWRAGGPLRWSLAPVGAALAAVAALTSSKAAYLAILAALFLAWCLTRERRSLRAVLIATALAVAAMVLAIAPIRHRTVRVFHDSAHVRLGYWSAGCQLAQAHPLLGDGLCGYRADADAALPEWGQYSTHAHCEPIEAAAEAGIPAGLALLALLAWLPWGRRAEPMSARSDAAGSSPSWISAAAVGVAIAYLSIMGMLQSNVSWWPGGENNWPGQLLWSIAIAVLTTAVVRLCARIAPPPPLACAIGLGALALHCLVDYDLHSGGVAGTAVVVAALAGGTVWRLGAASGQPAQSDPAAAGRMRMRAALPAALAALLCAAGMVWWGWYAARARAGEAVVEALKEGLASGKPTDAELKGLSDIASDIGVTTSQPGGMLDALIDKTNELAWPDYPLRLELLALEPPGPGRAERTEALARAWPGSAAVQALWSDDERVAARQLGGMAAIAAWHAALAHMRNAVALSPWLLRMREGQVRLLLEAAGALPAERIGLEVAARAAAAEVQRLRPVVDWTNRN